MANDSLELWVMRCEPSCVEPVSVFSGTTLTATDSGARGTGLTQALEPPNMADIPSGTVNTASTQSSELSTGTAPGCSVVNPASCLASCGRSPPYVESCLSR